MRRILLLTCLAGYLAQVALAAEDLPRELSDAVFWKMIAEFSEPGADFVNGNFVSNEDDYQAVLPALLKTTHPGGVYLGVGPEQNFTYISATRPDIAFIVDIRRPNMVTHLLYKALFEISSSRIDFLSRLFSRTTATGLTNASSVSAIFEAYERVPWDESLYDANLTAVYDQLLRHHGFPLSNEDKKVIVEALTYFAAGPRRFWTTGNASYSRLMQMTDHAGRNWSYLATEENFRQIQEYHRRNLIVPLVGDFAGPKAIRSVGDYARQHNAVLSVFYTSNVDEYLFKDRKQAAFYTNISTIPIDASSSMIRVVAGPGGGFDGTYQLGPGKMWAVMLCPIPDLIRAFKEERIRSRTDVNRLSHQ